ncbi:hypothetical protein GCM10023093_28040 [Nemorincola caseinilytica]|uniref:Secretion system C-terminal sorting domain-containing protein n=2 Tax=Nemorincola caseinilytica TaxID=2054315 RepID=A0ABP8NPU8_9BACT
MLRAYAQTIIYSQNFESVAVPGLPTGWTETHSGGGDGWETHKGPTRWPLGEVADHTTYCIVDDNKKFWNDVAQLTTTTFSMAGATNPHLSFDCVHMGFWGYEIAWVEISTNGGASFTVLDTVDITGLWATEFMDMSAYTGATNCKLRFCYHSTPGSGAYGGGLFGLAIDNIKIFDPIAAADLGITYITPQKGTVESYVRVGDSATFIGGIYNAGLTDATAYTVYWQIGSGTPMSQFFTSPVCTSFGVTSFTAFSVPYVVPSVGPKDVKIWIAAPGDTNPANDTIRTTITGFAAPHMPTKRLFTEELTGTWCGWCPKGIVYMDSLWKMDSAYASIVCVHSKVEQDGMAKDNATTRIYDTFTNRNMMNGYPSLILDRRKKHLLDETFNEMRLNKKTFGFADIGVTQTTTGGVLKARATIKPAMELTGDHRLELIVTEDGVTGTDWWFQQANAYHISALEMYGCGYSFDDSADIIAPGSIKFRFVARWSIPEDLYRNPNGIAGSLPSALHTDSFYSYDFPAVTIPANWNPNRLRCIALLIDNNTESPTYGHVLNSATTSHPPVAGAPAAVSSTSNAAPVEMRLYPNPASDEVRVSFALGEATVTDVCVYDALGRRVAIAPARQMAGMQEISISTADLPAGLYTVMLRSGDIRVSQLLSVVK